MKRILRQADLPATAPTAAEAHLGLLRVLPHVLPLAALHQRALPQVVLLVRAGLGAMADVVKLQLRDPHPAELASAIAEGNAQLATLRRQRAEGEARQEVKRTADIFRGQMIDVTADTYTIQLVGPSNKLDAFIRAIDDISILEVVRSGVSGISRGSAD